MTTEGMQGAHGIPQQSADEFRIIFDENLPGWNVNGGYNLSAQTSTQMASLQLNKLLHSELRNYGDKITVTVHFTHELR
jgi:hypothetical protein